VKLDDWRFWIHYLHEHFDTVPVRRHLRVVWRRDGWEAAYREAEVLRAAHRAFDQGRMR
jgi:hypothetical protein